jgi:hypothetical protein
MIERLSSRTFQLIADGLIAGAALYLAYLARYDGAIPSYQQRQLVLGMRGGKRV